MPYIEVVYNPNKLVAKQILSASFGEVKTKGAEVAIAPQILNAINPVKSTGAAIFYVATLVAQDTILLPTGICKVIVEDGEFLEPTTEYANRFADGDVEFSEVTSDTSSDGSKKPHKPLPLLTIIKKDNNYQPPDPMKEGFYVDPDIWYFLMWSYLQKNQVLLVGDTGTGKTSLPRILMSKVNNKKERFNHNLHSFEIYDMQTSNPEAELKGTPAVSNGKTYFRYSRFSKNIQAPGLSVLNEINRGSKMVQNILLSVLDDEKTLFIERSEDTQKIPVDPDHTFFATANIGVDFTGTTSIDKAFMRRFDVVELEAPPEEKRVTILKSREGISTLDAGRIVKLSSLVDDANLSKRISMAEELKVANKIAGGYNFLKAIDFTLMRSFSGGDNGEQAQLRTLIQQC